MITSKEELNHYLAIEKNIYCINQTKTDRLRSFLFKDPKRMQWKYIKSLRKLEYFFNNRHKAPFYAVMNIIYGRKFNKLGSELGIELDRNVCEAGLTIYHSQGIVINGDSKIGKNCMLHGGNVIGNKGTDLKAPVIGNNVRLGAHSMVLGDVYIADDIQIGAGAVVLESCYEKGALLTGVPAKIHPRKNEKTTYE